MKHIEIIQADVPTAKGRTYSGHVMKEAIEECQDAVKGRRMMLHKPSDSLYPPIECLIGVVTRAEFDGSHFKVEYEMLPGKARPDAIHPIMQGELSESGIVKDAKILYFEAHVPEKEKPCS